MITAEFKDFEEMMGFARNLVSTVETPGRQGESRSCCDIAMRYDIITCSVTSFWAWRSWALFRLEANYVTYYKTDQTDQLLCKPESTQSTS